MPRSSEEVFHSSLRLANHIMNSSTTCPYSDHQHRSAGPARSRGRIRRRRRWVIEELEPRTLLSGGPTVYTVDSTTATGAGSGDSGDLVYCTNQAEANTNPAGSDIEFDPTVFNIATRPTISLSGSLVLTETAGPVVFDGPGANVLTINGNRPDEDWIFLVDAARWPRSVA